MKTCTKCGAKWDPAKSNRPDTCPKCGTLNLKKASSGSAIWFLLLLLVVGGGVYIMPDRDAKIAQVKSMLGLGDAGAESADSQASSTSGSTAGQAPVGGNSPASTVTGDNNPAGVVSPNRLPGDSDSTADNEILTLISKDGQTIKAKVIALTTKTVLIRREDGQTFDLPLDRLSDESVQAIKAERERNRS